MRWLARFAGSPPSLPPATLVYRVVGDDDAAAGYFVSTAQRCRGYVLPIIDAPDDRSREPRKSGLRETHSILKGLFYCVLVCNVRDHTFTRAPRVKFVFIIKNVAMIVYPDGELRSISSVKKKGKSDPPYGGGRHLGGFQ